MPTGSLSLLEALKGGEDQVKAGVIETMLQESPFMEQLPWLTIAGTALKASIEQTLPDVQFRAVNGTYNKSWGADSEEFWGVTILGGEVSIDPFLISAISNKVDQKARQWAKFAKSNSMRFDYEVLNGDGTANGFKGLKQLVDEGKGQKLINATGGGAISLDKMDEAHDLFRNTGTADAIICNRNIRRQITKAARTSISGVALIDVGNDMFGRQVTQWNGVGIRFLGDVRNGSGQTVDALPFTEDPGDGTSDTSSLWFVKFGTDDVCGLVGNGGSTQFRNFGETEAAPQILGRFEWYPGLAVFNKYSAVRLYGITAG